VTATTPFIVPLDRCVEPALVGGKAAGLGRLIRAGFRVPPGVCLTATAYRHALQAGGFDVRRGWERARLASGPAQALLLEECRRRIMDQPLPPELLDDLSRQLPPVGAPEGAFWAVRSSCTAEDAEHASFGGLFRTSLGVRRENLPAAIRHCWASMWTLPAWAYGARADTGWGQGADPPAMAVVLQPLVAARSAGVGYSRHPVTGHSTHVVINAVHGLAEPLVAGEVTPDHYVVECPLEPVSARLIERVIAEKTLSRGVGPTGLRDEPLTGSLRGAPVLNDQEAIAVARLIKQVEQAMGAPVDVEWASDPGGLWLLQARPVLQGGGPAPLTVASCTWSRANFRETLPDVPSPLAVALLEEFMEACILVHYREVGCRIPRGLASVRVLNGRPYINVTLMQWLMAQLGGDPSEVTDLMGGEPVPSVPGAGRLSWRRLMRAGILIRRKLLQASKRAPAWFAELRRLGKAQAGPELEGLTEPELLRRLLELDEGLRAGDLTFALVGRVSQAFMALRFALEKRLGARWRPLLNAATRGTGAIISAKQIAWLIELAERARTEPAARDFLLEHPWQPEAFRSCLAGTAFLRDLDDFLAEYGHRAIGESDPMVPRFAERPEYVLGIVRGHLQAGSFRCGEAAGEEQARARDASLAEIRKALAWRLPAWLWFRWWHDVLCRAQALREANRHALMHYLAGVRRLLLELGRKLATRGWLETPEDVFFLLPDEIRALVAELAGGPSRDWRMLVAGRREDMARHVEETAPEVVRPGRSPGPSEVARDGADTPGTLTGLPISGGYAEGPVRLIRSPEALARVRGGDVLVIPAIDPGMAPLMGLASALVIEMGGMLSHGAIIAREYGIPAVANVREATRLLKDGERVAVDAVRGEVRRL
jgi:phosphohistidine swiveling domain-containing protein